MSKRKWTSNCTPEERQIPPPILWCDTCDTDTIMLTTGICGFCDTVLATEKMNEKWHRRGPYPGFNHEEAARLHAAGVTPKELAERYGVKMDSMYRVLRKAKAA